MFFIVQLCEAADTCLWKLYKLTMTIFGALTAKLFDEKGLKLKFPSPSPSPATS